MRQQLLDIRSAFSASAYPFPHAKPDATISEYLFDGGIPPATDPNALCGLAGQVLNHLFSLHQRVLSRLAESAATPPG